MQQHQGEKLSWIKFMGSPNTIKSTKILGYTVLHITESSHSNQLPTLFIKIAVGLVYYWYKSNMTTTEYKPN